MSGRHIGRHRPHSDPYFRDGAEVAFLGGDGKQYCSDTREGITCNRDRVGKWERFTVVVVGHNKIALRSGRTGKYCAERENALECHSNRIREWEVFHVNRLSNMLSLRGGRTRKFCSDTEDGIICDKKFVKRSEVFTVVKLNEDGKPEHPRDQHHKVLEHPLHMYDKGIVREPRHPHTPAGEEEEFSASGMMREVEKGKGVYEFFFN